MAGTTDIIAYGFGSWSTVAKVPTLGFLSGTVQVPTASGPEWTMTENRLHSTIPEKRMHWVITEEE